jgi:hypothetical protein
MRMTKREENTRCERTKRTTRMCLNERRTISPNNYFKKILIRLLGFFLDDLISRILQFCLLWLEVREISKLRSGFKGFFFSFCQIMTYMKGKNHVIGRCSIYIYIHTNRGKKHFQLLLKKLKCKYSNTKIISTNFAVSENNHYCLNYL